LTDVVLDEVEVLMEYRLPRSSKWTDIVVLSQHPHGGPSCVVV
jgi:hypothetical protein